MNPFSVKISLQEVGGTSFSNEADTFEAFLGNEKSNGPTHSHFREAGAMECILLSGNKILTSWCNLQEVMKRAHEFPAMTGLRFLWVKKPVDIKDPIVYSLSWDPFTSAMVIMRSNNTYIVSFAQNVFKVFDEDCLGNVYNKCVKAYEASLADYNFANKTLDDITKRIETLYKEHPLRSEMNRAHLHHVNFSNGQFSLRNNVEIKFWYIDQERHKGLKDEISFECGQTRFRELKYSQLGDELLALILKIARNEAIKLRGVDQIEKYAAIKLKP